MSEEKHRGKTQKQWIEEAARQHTNLCLFGSVVAIMEGGNVHGGKAQAAAQQIINRCQTAMQTALRSYDEAAFEGQNFDGQ